MVTPSQITLSIVVTIYNLESYIGDCIDSLINVKIRNKEIILIDDGSTDQSIEIIDNYASMYEYIHVIHKKNQGVSSARNLGIKEARGKYLVFIDGDDWVIADRLEDMYKEAITNNSDLTMGNLLYHFSNGEISTPYSVIPEKLCNKIISGRNAFVELMKLGAYNPVVCIFLYKKEWLDKQELFFESVLHEDELWTPQAFCLADSVDITNIQYYCYRQHEDSIMHNLNRIKRLESLIYIANKLIKFSSIFYFDNSNGEVKSMLYVKAYSLYQLAFEQLNNLRKKSLILPSHSLYTLFKICRKLSPGIRTQIYWHYRKAQQSLRSYLKWRISDWASPIPLESFTEKHIILIYNDMWGNVEIPTSQIPDNYLFTTNRDYLNLANTVIFHLPTLKDSMDDVLDKPNSQIWVAWTLECEDNYIFTKNSEIMNLFDFWISYHQVADVVHSYLSPSFPKLMKQPINKKEKKGNICMLISSPFNQSSRQEYLKELMQEIPIDSYGILFNNKTLEHDNGRAGKMKLYKQYKFIISFENSCATDYVTEKFFDPLIAGAVPIYYGAPNIDEYAPGKNCFIDVRKFESPLKLAEYIRYCCENDSEYQTFFKWKTQKLSPGFVKKVQIQKVHPFVRLCKLLDAHEDRIKSNIENKIILGDIYLCSFADSRFKESPIRVLEQSTDFEIFSDVYIYNEQMLPTYFTHEFKDQLILGSKGYGYWVWKPCVILDSLNKIKDNDILLYMDMGCHLNSNAITNFIDYWKEVKYNESGFLVTQLESERIEKYWTKGDLFDYLGVRNNSNITDTPQYQGGVIFIRKNAATVKLIKEWLNVFRFDFKLADDTPSLSNNFEGFIEHRHDQSILSILLKIHKASVIPINIFYCNDYFLSERKYPILIKRDLI